jgi:MFS family permease
MVAIIGTCQIGCLYMLAPISISVLEAWPEMRRFTSVIGLAIVLASLVASSFAANVWQLVVTQGVLYGIGGNLLYTPLMFYLDEWFVHRKGLAFGVVWAGGST